MAKKVSDVIKEINIMKPETMSYYVNLESDKMRFKFIERVKKIVRGSMEYKDYINFLKEHMDLDKCVFFQKIEANKNNRKNKLSIELHHEPFTLHDYVEVVLSKFEDEGQKINDLLIADEVLRLHYENKVGLVPLSKTIHQVIHADTKKLVIPLNVCYGEYSAFLEEYEKYIPDEMYEKLERKINMTKNLTPESFDAIMKEFTYITVDGYEQVSKVEIEGEMTA